LEWILEETLPSTQHYSYICLGRFTEGTKKLIYRNIRSINSRNVGVEILKGRHLEILT
jgi:hypothetical protein